MLGATPGIVSGLGLLQQLLPGLHYSDVGQVEESGVPGVHSHS